MNEVFIIYILYFNLAISIFAIYSAIRGKGIAYRNELPKAIQAKANKMVRIFLGIIGPVMLGFSILGVLKIGGLLFVYLNIACVLLAVILFTLLFNLKYRTALRRG